MARVIADILDADTLAFNQLVEKWEQRTGRRGHDLSLYSDMRSRAIRAIKELGLDPADTIGRELYYAIQERAKQDNRWLAERIGVSKSDNPEKALKKIIKWVVSQAEPTSVWACKPSLMKTFIKKQPPKTVMKSLGLRSIDSMLKRNNAAEIVTLASGLETPEWNSRFRQQYKKCRPVDFAERPLEWIVLSSERVEKIKARGYPVNRLTSPNYELGTLMIIPPPYRFPLDVLAAVVSIAEAIYDIRKHAALYRTLSVRKDFGAQLEAIASLGITKATLAMSEIGWNSLHRHLVGNDLVVAKIEQPHLGKEDLLAESSVRFLVKQDPRFNYWKDLEYALFTHSDLYPVSLNIVDVVMNASNRLPYNQGSLSYARMRLWEELWARYLSSDQVIEDVIDSYLK